MSSLQERKIVREESIRPYKTPQQKRQRLIAVIVVLVIAALGAGAYFLLVPREDVYRLKGYETAEVVRGDMVQTTQGSGSVQLPVQLTIPSPEAGYSAELYVEDGEMVAKGQLLARLDVPDLEIELEDLQTDLDDAKRDLILSDAQDETSMARKNREIESLAEDIETQQAEVQRIRKLVAINASRQSDLDGAESKLQDLKDQQEEMKLQYEEDSRLQGIQRQSRQATIQKLETRIKRLEDRIAAATIFGPMDGDILSVDSTLGVPGSVIKAGQSLFTIADPNSAIVELEVDEEVSSFLQIGQKVSLTVGGSNLTGTISSIGKVAQVSSDGLGATVSIKVVPDAQSDSLLLGSTAVGEMQIGVSPDVLLLPRGPYLTTGSQKYLYLVEGDAARRVKVTFGKVSGQLVEVVSGVDAGDEVIISGYQNYIEYETIRLEGGD
jgi:HlyD family secretion protein